MTRKSFRRFLLCLTLTLVLPALAQVQQRRENIPVEVDLASGEKLKRDIELVIFENASGLLPKPVIVFGHGKPAGTTTYSTWAWMWTHSKSLEILANLGFTVVVPMRIGQGDTGGPVIEESACPNTQHKVIFGYATSQLMQTIDWVIQQPKFDKTKIVYVGQSMGGAAALAIASLNPSSVKLAINFAGGNAGNPQRWPKQPCNQDVLSETFADYGKTARLPTLWLYGLNDYYWGKDLPVKWANEFQANGGKVDFQQVESNTMEGHDLFRRSPEVWLPLVSKFLEKNGMLPSK